MTASGLSAPIFNLGTNCWNMPHLTTIEICANYYVSESPPHEGVLVELRPLLVLAKKVRAIGEIEFLHRLTRRHVAARRVVADALPQARALLGGEKIDEQHGRMRMRRLARDGD